MRKRIWIPPLLVLALGSLLVIQGRDTPSAPATEVTERRDLSVQFPSPSPTPTTTAASDNRPTHSFPRESPAANLAAAPDHRDTDTSTRVQDSLDLATPTEIRRVLREAIEREKRNRPLFVSSGIVDAVASARRVRIIFETRSGLSTEAARTLLGGETGIAEFDSLRVYPLLDRGAASVGPQALLHLIANPGTGQIELDAIHRPSLLETIPIIRADLAHQQGFDGDGFAIAVLDTGTDLTHPMYADRIIEEACFSVENDCPNGLSEMVGPGASAPCAINGCGHGTRVSGIALGDEVGGSLRGSAPHADLIAIQIFSVVDGELGAYASDILAGLQHVLGLTVFHEIAAVNLSFGGVLFPSEAACDQNVPSQLDAVSLLRSAGVLTVAAAGNESSTDSITTPGCLSNVLAIGSTSDLDVVSIFSNSAAFLGLLAPGELVQSSSVGGSTGTASGTSLATPHVAGAIAAIREAIPEASADEIANALALTGIAISDERNGVTTPRIQVLEAITFLEATLPPGGGVRPPVIPQTKDGGGACGLIGIECFLVLGIVRLGRRQRMRKARSLDRPGQHVRR